VREVVAGHDVAAVAEILCSLEHPQAYVHEKGHYGVAAPVAAFVWENWGIFWETFPAHYWLWVA
jgi:hypothetical protein